MALAEARVRLVVHVVARRVGGDLRQGGARRGGVDPHVETFRLDPVADDERALLAHHLLPDEPHDVREEAQRRARENGRARHAQGAAARREREGRRVRDPAEGQQQREVLQPRRRVSEFGPPQDRALVRLGAPVRARAPAPLALERGDLRAREGDERHVQDEEEHHEAADPEDDPRQVFGPALQQHADEVADGVGAAGGLGGGLPIVVGAVGGAGGVLLVIVVVVVVVLDRGGQAFQIDPRDVRAESVQRLRRGDFLLFEVALVFFAVDLGPGVGGAAVVLFLQRAPSS